MTITEVTRRNIFDSLRVEGCAWSGRLEETKFLSRIFDLQSLPSYNTRLRNLEDDIWQHRVNNDDWEDDWVFDDERFNLLHGPDEVFLRFLCEMVHPVVQPNLRESQRLVGLFNSHLRADGWEIVERTRISDKPVYAPRRRLIGSSLSIKEAKAIAEEINADYVNRQISRLESSIGEDPELAIGTAKEFAETICKSILDDHGVDYNNDVNLTTLVKLVCKQLQIAPEDIPETTRAADSIKKLLRQLAAISHGMLEIRNAYGTGHGKTPGTTGFKPRHARLAVHAVIAIVEFLFETHQEKSTPL